MNFQLVPVWHFKIRVGLNVFAELVPSNDVIIDTGPNTGFGIYLQLHSVQYCYNYSPD